MRLDSKRRYRSNESARADPVHYVRTILLCLFMVGSRLVFSIVKLADDPLEQMQFWISLFALGIAAVMVWLLYKDARGAYRNSGSGAQASADSRDPDAI